MKQVLFGGLAALSMFIYACQGTSKNTGGDTSAVVTTASPSWKLEGTRWKLKEFPANPIAIPPSEKDIYISFVDTSSQIQGFLGCNGFGGKYLATAQGDLQISDVISTQMACPSLDVENALGKAMAATSKYTIDKDLLRLQRGDSILATFTAIQQ
ncbi:META domain-containing protein [Chitinophaga niabensis]|uniref:Heat shock protein HslJ n=1 Tax=Chitinophaga niabensis TaxID=536979 RepID=A0A1N6JMA7_9BACT|nr:META domain-containing protein [Chitinophaga niabensis]SIO45307.1 Heat shock protein HslJ [Chitinophaga niabensis]